VEGHREIAEKSHDPRDNLHLVVDVHAFVHDAAEQVGRGGPAVLAAHQLQHHGEELVVGHGAHVDPRHVHGRHLQARGCDGRIAMPACLGDKTNYSSATTD